MSSVRIQGLFWNAHVPSKTVAKETLRCRAWVRGRHSKGAWAPLEALPEPQGLWPPQFQTAPPNTTNSDSSLLPCPSVHRNSDLANKALPPSGE